MDRIEESSRQLMEIGLLLEELVGDLEMARALSGAVNELVDYARADVSDNVLDAEPEALAVSKRVVRELFEQKLQRELDRHDEASARRPIPCSKCDRAMPSQGRRELSRRAKATPPVLLLRKLRPWTGTGAG